MAPTNPCRRRPESYYAVLGIRPDATPGEIRSAYRKLALKWHPDRWRRQPSWLLDEANRMFQTIHEAYQVLSDLSKRSLYDAGLYENGAAEEEEEVEGFSEFVQEMTALMADVRREGREYGLNELRNMLADIARSFESSSPPPPPPPNRWSDGGVSRGGRSKRIRTGDSSSSQVHHASGFGLFGSTSCC